MKVTNIKLHLLKLRHEKNKYDMYQKVKSFDLQSLGVQLVSLGIWICSVDEIFSILVYQRFNLYDMI